MVDDIEEKFRRVALWLASLNVNDRPYVKQGGWKKNFFGTGGSYIMPPPNNSLNRSAG
jgi:hypothetical protein